eukprot:12292002-Karenia_brevis.AAC.1
MQLLPSVVIQSSKHIQISASILRRSLGVLTGSRVGNLVSQIPTRQILTSHFWQLQRFGFQIDAKTKEDRVSHLCKVQRCSDYSEWLNHVKDPPFLLVAFWVDNIFAFSNSINGACSIVRDIGKLLADSWNLFLKDDSLQVIACKGHNQ